MREKVSGDILGYLPLETGELVGIVREKEKPILLLIIAVIAALVLLVALITASLYKMVNKPLDGSGSDASSASSEIVIADGEAYDGTMDNGKTDSEEMRFIEFPAFTTMSTSNIRFSRTMKCSMNPITLLQARNTPGRHRITLPGQESTLWCSRYLLSV